MAAATPSITELMSQMQQNLDAINYHLARISDTKAHDDEIERLENERQKRADILSVQFAHEVKQLEEKRKQLGQPAAEKHRQEREKIVAKRAQEERDLAAARRREDEEILARRMKEDAAKQARLEQEDKELKSIAQKEEEHIKASLAGEEERKRREAAERENSLYEEFDAHMTQLEDEMERKVVESTKLLSELDEKRKAISAQIDALMKPARRPPTFRRGSKRYSITGLAADVAAMLGGRPSLDRRSTLSQIDEQNGPAHTEIPRDIPTPAQSEHTPSSRMSYAGSIRSLRSEDAEDIKAREEMARINAELMAEMEAERTGTPKRTDSSSSVPRISPSSASIRSTKSEDPEDVRAREEMARINVEIMAAAAAEQQAQVSATSRAVKPETDEDIRAREEVGRLNAKIMEEERLSKQAQQARPPQLPSVTSHQRLPTWVNQAKLAIVKGSHGVMKFRKEGADMDIVESTRAVDQQRPQQSKPNLEPFVYSGPKHALLPTWVDQASLPIVSGSHGVLKFGDVGASMDIVSSPLNQSASQGSKYGGADVRNDRSAQPAAEPTTFSDEPLRPLLQPAIVPEAAWFGKRDSLTGHLHNITSRDMRPDSASHIPGRTTHQQDLQQKRLTAPNGLGSATMNHGLEKQHKSMPERMTSKVVVAEVAGGKYDLNHPALKEMVQAVHANAYLYWHADQGKLPVIRGSHGSLEFHQHGAELKIAVSASANRYWAGNQSALSVVRGKYGSLKFGATGAVMKAVPLNPYWVDQGELAVVTGEHGFLTFYGNETVMKVRKSDPYWTDQRTLRIVKGSHGRLAFGAYGANMEIVRPDPYWVDQSTLVLVTGKHGFLSFGEDGAVLKVSDPYWVDQSTLSLVRGTHGKLSFTSNGASLEIVRPDLYWVDQATLTLVIGKHGILSFGEDGAVLKVRDPYWVDQSTLSVVKGSHGRLAFTWAGASLEIVRPDPYWVDQSTLAVVEGSHGRLAFGPYGASLKVVRADPYWSGDQRRLDLVMGPHATLKFDASGARLEIVEPNHSYWAANQAELNIVRGSHGLLVFNGNGANLKIAGLKYSYWTANQTDLEVVRGSHGMLVFNASGASLRVPRSINTTSNVYWKANKTSLKTIQGSHGSLHFTSQGANVHVVQPKRPYWIANQAGLTIIQGSHGSLNFTDEKVVIHAIQPNGIYWLTNQTILPMVQGSHGMLAFDEMGASIKVECPPTPYWTANQAKLEEVRGSHGTLQFTMEGAAIHARSNPEDTTTQRSPLSVQNASSYWVDQAHLEKIQGNHGKLVFNGSISASVSHTNDQPLLDSFASPPGLETGDFFPDSDSEAEEGYQSLPKRTSFGPGAFASMLNTVKDRVPIVTNLVGNGSYSSFENDEESPITPTDESSSLINHNQQALDEPIIHSSPDSSRHQERPFDNHHPGFEEHREVKLSPLPTQLEFEFDPIFHQVIRPPITSPTLTRSPISTKPFESTVSLASNNPFRSSIPVRTRSGARENSISRARSMFGRDKN